MDSRRVMTRSHLAAVAENGSEIVFRRAVGTAFFHALDLLELAHGLRRLRAPWRESDRQTLQRRDFLLLIFVSGDLLLFRRLRAVRRSIPVAAIADEFRIEIS